MKQQVFDIPGSESLDDISIQPGIFNLIARKILTRIRNMIEYYLFFTRTLFRLVQLHRIKKICWTVLFRQILFTGVDALFIIALLALSTSALTIIEVQQLTGHLGENRLVYELLVVIVLRQVSVIFTAFVLIARSGTAMSTELGNMIVNKEVDLLYSLGVSPIDYLVVPRVLSMIVSLFALTLYYNIFTVLGGYIFHNLIYSDVSLGVFIIRIIRELNYSDFFLPVIKTVLLGTFIGMNSCYQGLKVRNATTEVPQRTINAVVNSVVAVIVLNIIITILHIYV